MFENTRDKALAGNTLFQLNCFGLGEFNTQKQVIFASKIAWYENLQ